MFLVGVGLLDVYCGGRLWSFSFLWLPSLLLPYQTDHLNPMPPPPNPTTVCLRVHNELWTSLKWQIWMVVWMGDTSVKELLHYTHSSLSFHRYSFDWILWLPSVFAKICGSDIITGGRWRNMYLTVVPVGGMFGDNDVESITILRKTLSSNCKWNSVSNSGSVLWQDIPYDKPMFRSDWVQLLAEATRSLSIPWVNYDKMLNF